MSEDTFHTVRANAVLITRKLYAVAAYAVEAFWAVIVAIATQIRNDREARRYAEVYTR